MKHLHRLFTVLTMLSMVLGLFAMPAFSSSSVALAQDEIPPEAEPLDETNDAQSTTGPIPPPEVLQALDVVNPYTPTTYAKTIGGVPVYYWRHGCGPTAAGMVIGYWDGYYDDRGIDWLIPDDASTQTLAVNEAIASQAETPSHYSDYSLPMDEFEDYPLLDTSSLLEVGDRHANNSIADFMQTSWSAEGNQYGWSWLSDISPALLGYAKMQNPGGFTVSSKTSVGASWAAYQAEINAGRPVILLVDSNGDKGTDHFITGVGYDTTASGTKMYAAYNTWDEYGGDDLRWYTFQPMTYENSWGIYSITTFNITAAAPAVPTLVSPANNAFSNDTALELVWNPAANAFDYEIQVSTASTFPSSYTETLKTGGDTFFTPMMWMQGKLYWRVRSLSFSDAPSKWSATRAFTIDTNKPNPPVLSLPGAGSTFSGTPVFSWKASVGATRYQFAFAPGTSNPFPTDLVVDPGDIGVAYYTGELTTLTHKPTIAMAPGNYYWSARAKDAAGNWGFWGNAFALNVTAPIPAAPLLELPKTKSLTNDNMPRLSWFSVPYGEYYRLQVDGSSKFIAPFDYEYTTDGLYHETTETLGEGVHYWRVQASYDGITYGKWSTAFYFTVDTLRPAAPALKFPANPGTYAGTPTFAWYAATGASRYQFAYSELDDFPTGEVTEPEDIPGIYYNTGELTTLTHKPTVVMALGNHYWSVRAKDAAGNWGLWSDARLITITPPVPAAPSLLTPTNYFTDDNTPTLWWDSVPYGVTYRLQVDNSSAFTSPEFNDTTSEQELSVNVLPSGLPDGKYYWRVQAANVNGTYGKVSTPRIFTVDTLDPAVPQHKLPLAGASFIGSTTFVWYPVVGASTYIIGFGPDAETVEEEILVLNGVAYKMSLPIPSVNFSFYWFIKAVDAAGNQSDWSAGRLVKSVPSTPAAPLLVSPENKFKTDDTYIELEWSEVLHGAAYQVQIDNSSAFTSVDYTYGTDEDPFYEVGPLPVGIWYWRVRAMNTNDVFGPPSAIRTFTILPKFNTQFNTDNGFESWVQHPGAAWYVQDGYLSTNGVGDYHASSASYPTTFTDFTYEARMMMNYAYDEPFTYNYYGLVARGTPTFNANNDWKTTYYFALYEYYDDNETSATDDDYPVACYTVIKVYNNSWTTMMDNCSTVINFNNWNNLKVYANGSSLKFYINDNLMWSKTVTGITGGRLGVFNVRGTTYYSEIPSNAPVYVDWAIAGEPVLPGGALSQTVTPNQWPAEFPSAMFNKWGLK